MPILGYLCLSKKNKRACNHEFEVFYQNHGAVEREEPAEACPKCGGLKKKRLINTGTTHILKGKGWARDGYS
jgi:predicted nucleic acid-binding Zn ribbon protein